MTSVYCIVRYNLQEKNYFDLKKVNYLSAVCESPGLVASGAPWWWEQNSPRHRSSLCPAVCSRSISPLFHLLWSCLLSGHFRGE